MREYRGKRVDNGEWVYGCLLCSPNFKETYIATINIAGGLTSIETVLPESVGQYIGLKDKEKDKIYKGDIYKIFDETKENKIYEILFKEGCFLAQARDGMKYHARTWAGDSCKIIGNTTDSPNLLESPK